MPLVVDPGQTLKFRIKIRPLFQRLRFSQPHLQGSLEIRRPRIRRIDVAMEFRIRKTCFDFPNHSQRLPLILIGLIRQSKYQRERAAYSRAMALLRDLMEDFRALESDFVDGAQDILRTRFSSDEYTA